MSTEDRKTGVSSIAELIEADEYSAKRRLVQLAAGGLIGIGLLFTGYLNFMLYSRAFPDNMKIFGLIPALLLEGSLALFLLGSFVWFAHGVQGTLAKIFGWLMFVIVGLNTVIEFNALTGSGDGGNEFLRLYAFWGTPLVLVLAIAFWKAVIDADPSVQIMRQRRKIQQTLQVAKMNAEINALGSEESRWALQVFGERSAADVNRRLIGEDVKQLPAAQPAQLASAQPGILDRIKQAVNPTPAAQAVTMASEGEAVTVAADAPRPVYQPQPRPRPSADLVDPLAPDPPVSQATRDAINAEVRTIQAESAAKAQRAALEKEWDKADTEFRIQHRRASEAQPAAKKGRPKKSG